MQDFEVPRYESACKAFSEAFEQGYAIGKRELGAGAEAVDDGLPFYIDVPKNDVLDDVWSKHIALFVEAGRRAARASRRQHEAKLDPHDAHPDGRHAFTGVLRWTAIEPA